MISDTFPVPAGLEDEAPDEELEVAAGAAGGAVVDEPPELEQAATEISRAVPATTGA